MTLEQKLSNVVIMGQAALQTNNDGIIEDTIKLMSRHLTFHQSHLMLSPDEYYIGTREGKLNAVKAYRERTGLSLMDCKRNVEHCFKVAGLEFR